MTRPSRAAAGRTCLYLALLLTAAAWPLPGSAQERTVADGVYAVTQA